MKTKVIITVDTEFSIAGAFVDPENNKPVGLQAVLCEKDGQSHGLGFILDTLNKYDITATFFVEALNANYFGYELMGQIAQTIVKRNQDIQLHLHPCWQYFKNKNWQTRLNINPPNDDICKRSLDEIESMLLEGVNVFSEWGMPRPKALRTGSLLVKKDVYKAMSKLGIRLSSNIGVGIFNPMEAELKLYSGCHLIENCFELPVLTYRDFKGLNKNHLKLLTVTGSSWGEIEYLLMSAAENKLGYLVVLTHPSEFVKRQNNQYTEFFPNHINRIRLEKLCHFLVANKENYSIVTFSDLPMSEIKDDNSNTLLDVPPWLTVKRIVENYANDKIRSL